MKRGTYPFAIVTTLRGSGSCLQVRFLDRWRFRLGLGVGMCGKRVALAFDVVFRLLARGAVGRRVTVGIRGS